MPPTSPEFMPYTEGVFRNLPAATYHAAPGVSNSMLSKMAAPNTPAHLKDAMTTPQEVTPAMVLGSLTHNLVLEPEAPLPKISIKPGDLRRNSKAYAAWKAEQGDNIEVTEDAFDALLGMTRSIAQDEYCKKVFRDGDTELSLFKRFDVEIGEGKIIDLLTRCRIDWRPRSNYLADVKTCVDASERAFSKHIKDMGYHRQAAKYLKIHNALFPDDQREGFLFIAVEKTPPYLVACYFLEPRAINQGLKEVEQLWKQYATCVDSGIWPGYHKPWSAIDLPKWVYGGTEE